MRWEDEQFVKVYTRDTVDWLALSYDARSLFLNLLRKVDRAGILPLGRHGRRGVAVLLGATGVWDRLEPALKELEDDGCLRVEDDSLVIPNFTSAQEARQTDRARKQAQRERDRQQAMGGLSVTARDALVQEARRKSQEVTPDVTRGHTESREVTLRRDETRREEKREDLPAPAGEQGDLLADEKPPKPKGPDPETLRELWNRLAPPKGLQRWEAMGDDRKRLARLSLAACPDLARWEAWLTYELGRPFNLGETGWKADVDWLLRAKTRNLVLDFNPAVATATKTASGGDVPRLGPKPVTPAPPAGDRPRL